MSHPFATSELPPPPFRQSRAHGVGVAGTLLLLLLLTASSGLPGPAGAQTASERDLLPVCTLHNVLIELSESRTSPQVFSRVAQAEANVLRVTCFTERSTIVTVPSCTRPPVVDTRVRATAFPSSTAAFEFSLSGLLSASFVEASLYTPPAFAPTLGGSSLSTTTSRARAATHSA
jgi:hypothetical protein